MAVQAQHPANIFRPTMNSNVLDQQQHDFYQFHQNNNLITAPGNVFGNTFTGKQQSNLIITGGGAVLSGDHLAAESELTCNLSASRKRNRIVDCDDHYQTMPSIPPNHHHHHHHHQSYLHLQPQQQNDHVLLQQDRKQQQNLRYSNKLQQINIGGCSNTGISINYEEINSHRLQHHHDQSGGTSTSGRSAVLTPAEGSQDRLINTNHHHLLHHQNLELDALILLHNEKLRSVIEETQKRQCTSLVSAVEEQVLKRLAEKETELQNAGRKNAELEEKLKRLNAENQICFNVAKNNEAIVSGLKSTLQQILLRNNNTKGELLLTPNTTTTTDYHDVKEGFGDSDGLVIEGLDDDTQSCCYGGIWNHNQEEEQRRLVDANSTIKKSCRVCGKNEVSVLVLPCRHLCLCKECESKLDYCPVCKAAKSASLQIFMS